MLPERDIDPLFEATLDTVQEAIVKGMAGADTVTGYQGHKVVSLPRDKLPPTLRRRGKLWHFSYGILWVVPCLNGTSAC
jgi:hypothetical protein